MNLIAGCIHWIDEKKDAGRVKEAVAGMKGDPGTAFGKERFVVPDRTESVQYPPAAPFPCGETLLHWHGGATAWQR